MEHRYYFDKSFTNFSIGLIWFGWFMLFIVSLTSGTAIKFLYFFIPFTILLVIIWIGLRFYSYVAIDAEKRKYYTKVLFIKREIFGLFDIIKVNPRGILVGLGTALQFTYRDKNGKLKTVFAGTKDLFRKGEFKKFIGELHTANPNIEIAEELFE